MPTPQLILEKTAYTIDQLLGTETAQLALAGRSNVGKSSLINALACRRKLAKVSSTPGKTRSVNYYRVSPWDFCLVDLPGYGYARANHAEREKWARLLERYLKECPTLKGLVLLIDSRLPPQTLDLNLMEYARSLSLPILPVLTKADKCRQRELAARSAEWQKLTGIKPVITSSSSRFGIQELWKALLRQVGLSPAELGPGKKQAAGSGQPEQASQTNQPGQAGQTTQSEQAGSAGRQDTKTRPAEAHGEQPADGQTDGQTAEPAAGPADGAAESPAGESAEGARQAD